MTDSEWAHHVIWFIWARAAALYRFSFSSQSPLDFRAATEIHSRCFLEDYCINPIQCPQRNPLIASDPSMDKKNPSCVKGHFNSKIRLHLACFQCNFTIHRSRICLCLFDWGCIDSANCLQRKVKQTLDPISSGYCDEMTLISWKSYFIGGVFSYFCQFLSSLEGTRECPSDETRAFIELPCTSSNSLIVILLLTVASEIRTWIQSGQTFTVLK
jgi:hypothetical protein